MKYDVEANPWRNRVDEKTPRFLEEMNRINRRNQYVEERMHPEWIDLGGEGG